MERELTTLMSTQTGLVHLGVPRLIMIYLLGVHYDQSTRTADISMGAAYIACDTTLLEQLSCAIHHHYPSRWDSNEGYIYISIFYMNEE